MPKRVLVGDSNSRVKAVKAIYVGDSSGIARKVVKGYVGDSSGVARQFWPPAQDGHCELFVIYLGGSYSEFPAIALSPYFQPADYSKCLYSIDDGATWQAATSNTIPLKDSPPEVPDDEGYAYVWLKGDWRSASGALSMMFYTVSGDGGVSGAFSGSLMNLTAGDPTVAPKMFQAFFRQSFIVPSEGVLDGFVITASSTEAFDEFCLSNNRIIRPLDFSRLTYQGAVPNNLFRRAYNGCLYLREIPTNTFGGVQGALPTTDTGVFAYCFGGCYALREVATTAPYNLTGVIGAGQSIGAFRSMFYASDSGSGTITVGDGSVSALNVLFGRALVPIYAGTTSNAAFGGTLWSTKYPRYGSIPSNWR